VDKATYVETDTGVMAIARLKQNGRKVEVTASGNGRLDAINAAIRKVLGIEYTLEQYTQHALEEKSTSQAAAYVSIRFGDKVYWGAGIDSDIIESSVRVLVSAVNRLMMDRK
jgi:2-isopropylmalate synthase